MAEVPLIDAENLFRQPGPALFDISILLTCKFSAPMHMIALDTKVRVPLHPRINRVSGNSRKNHAPRSTLTMSPL
jgi:hypothetical protein